MTRTFNWKIVFKTLGALLLIEALFMCMPTLVSHIYQEYDTGAFIISTIITFIAGLLGLFAGRHAPKKVGQREGYVIVASIWIVFAAFGCLPMYLSGACTNITDSYFESMSGFSTFGGTIFDDVEVLSHGVLFWRALSQWIGGMGIIVLSVAVLPMFGLGGMQLYSAEVTGVSYEKLGPRISGTAKVMWLMYILMTISEIILLWLCGMESFDAICHSLSTVATGGFSTKNSSIIGYSPSIQWIVAIYMLLSGINFTLLIFVFKGRPSRLWRDEETRWYVGSLLVFTIFMAISLVHHFIPITDLSGGWQSHLAMVEKGVREAFFTVVSAVTSTGFAAADYSDWPRYLWVMVVFLMLLGGCAGSTAGGMKQIRVVLLLKNGIAECQRRIHPNAVIPAKLNGTPMSQQTVNNVMAFIFFYLVMIIIGTMIYCLCGLPFDLSIGTAVSAVGDVGVCIGQFAPPVSYASFPAVAKWTSAILMLIGRLEIFTVILLFSPTLWRK